MLNPTRYKNMNLSLCMRKEKARNSPFQRRGNQQKQQAFVGNEMKANPD